VENSNDTKKVILDVLGGDKGAATILEGAKIALKKDKTLQMILVGDEAVIREYLRDFADRIEIIHTTTNIGMNEIPTEAIRKKTDSSIVLGMDALRKRDDCGAFVSAGSTGAVLTGAFMKVGRIEGILRPAMTPFLNTINHRGVYVCDVGANMDCKGENLAQFAVMLDVYLREIGIQKPRIAMLNVGTEENKGNNLAHDAYKLLCELRDKRGLNFVGNIEGREAFYGNVDAIVCDGFDGNICLKTLEGAGKFFESEFKHVFRGALGFFGKLIFARRLLKMKSNIRDDSAGGALFLGVKKPVVKAHGNSSSISISNAIRVAVRAGKMDLATKIADAIK
jgi:glycerol-3-phosphate acyltransferase PlsX